MRTYKMALVAFAAALAACSADRAPDARRAEVGASAAAGNIIQSTHRQHASAVAAYPDRGKLFAFERGRAAERNGAYSYYPVQLSEAHALRAISSGTLALDTPRGGRLTARYIRHVEHPDGSWSWVGHVNGRASTDNVVITFGEKAVFGSVPTADGELQLTTMRGRTWLVDSDPKLLASMPAADAAPDFVEAPVLAQVAQAKRTAQAMGAARLTSAAADPAPVTVDLLLGYTTGFAQRLGGTSQALTRLNNLVDIANDAYATSSVAANLNLVATLEVNYPDATANRTALFELSGVQCSNGPGSELPSGGVTCNPATRPAELQRLADAREQYGADLVALVRKLEYPENQSCGIGWLLGGGQTAFDSTSDDFAYSVISDSSGNTFPDSGATCRSETLVHELGHNMGLQHDQLTAQGSDDSNSDGNLLDPEEFGHHAYSFGYSTDASNGNFYTVMAVRRTGQTGYRIFSTPDIAGCSGLPCGVAGQNDDARSLRESLPTIAAFRMRAINFGDVPPGYWAYDAIRRVYDAGITSGCSVNPALFCPTAVVKRDQMAVFLLRGMHGGGYQPPAVTTSRFADVGQGYWAISWIEQIAQEQITSGCGVNPPVYCPAGSVSRAQMAVFLLRAKYGAAFVPPAPTGVFSDVPTSYWAAGWIEKLAADGISGGCGSGKFCPESAVTRDQMAVFMTRAFAL